MEKKDGYWEGKNGNKWDAERYTKDEAIVVEKTLKNCENCINCSRCSGCFDCSGCSGCSRCFDCSDCSGCSGCFDCSRCSGCFDCSGCSGCFDCSGFKKNPRRYTGQKMGSRNAQTTTYWLSDYIQVVCGCYKGTLDEFEERVKAVHGSTVYGKAYAQYITIVRRIMKMEQGRA